jgi:hypothetical protein
MLAGDPGQGGATWAVLQYVHGFEQLGHDVRVVEPINRWEPAVERYFAALELPQAALLAPNGRRTVGLSYDRLASFDAELLINVSGILRDPELLAPIPTRVFLDLDPVFTQIWLAQGHLDELAHTHYVTVGTRLQHVGVPLGHRWRPTLPPVALDRWQEADAIEHDAFTTVGNWRSYGTVQWGGTVYGQKAHSVRRLLELPGLTRQAIRAALAIHPDEVADLTALREHGWELVDPAEVAATPAGYQRFVSGSKGELGLAKAGYVDSRCGWFSDRSACYLAAGRPVVAQDTGFADALPTGAGLLAFGSATEGATAIDAVCADYDRHRRDARALAAEYLDARTVLGRLLQDVL